MDKKIKINVVFNFLYQILALIIPLITMPYLSRVLGVENLGIHSYTLSIVSYFTLFASFGFESYGQREIARNKDDKEKISQLFWEIFITRLITSFAVLIIYGVMLFTVFEHDYQIFYIIMIMNILTITFDIAWFFQGIENFKSLALRNSIIKLLGLVFTFVFVKKAGDLWIYTLIYSGSLLLSSLSIWLTLRKKLVKIRINFHNILRHFKGSLVFFIPSIAIQIYTILDKSMIQWITGSNAQNGYYDQSEKIVKVFITVVQVQNVVMRSRMSYLFNKGKNDEAKELCYTSFSLFSIIAFPSALGIVLVAPQFIPIYLGDGYEQSILLLQIFSLLIIFIGTSGLVGSHYMTPIGKQNISNYVLIGGSVINLILNSILIPIIGALGAAISSVVAEGFIAVLYLFNIRKFIKPMDLLKISYKHIISAIIMFVVVYFTCAYLNLSNWTLLIIKIFEGILVYFIMLLVLKDNTCLKYIKIILLKLKMITGKRSKEN